MRWCASHLTRLIAVALLTGVVVCVRAEETSTAPQPAVSEWADLSQAYDSKAGVSDAPVDKLTLPLEHYESGRVRAVLRAVQATRTDDGFVRALRVRIDLFDETGHDDGVIVAENALFNMDTKRGYCRGAVSVHRQDVEISGRDLYWSMPQQRVVVIADARMVVKDWKRKRGDKQ
ncbi:MAG: hypothetical protein WCG22_01315 [Lentisphaerota bacterium]